jgi:hypothetical protein
VYKHNGNKCYRKMGAERVRAYVFCASEEKKRVLCAEVLQKVLQSAVYLPRAGSQRQKGDHGIL